MTWYALSVETHGQRRKLMALVKEFNELELNRKLAEWAGFVEMKDIYKGDRYTVGWEYPDDSELGRLPKFTQSLDACYKWLWMKATKILADNEREGSSKLLDLWLEKPDPFSPLTLCLTIEKLIDGETK